LVCSLDEEIDIFVGVASWFASFFGCGRGGDIYWGDNILHFSASIRIRIRISVNVSVNVRVSISAEISSGGYA